MWRSVAAVTVAVFVVGCRARVQHGLDERDANEIVGALAGRGFDVGKIAESGRRPSFAIDVPAREATDAMRLLTELRLPRPPRALTRDVVSQQGLVDTPTAERARQLEGVEGDLEQSLELLDGVASAGVELAVPSGPARPGQPAAPPRASVLLRVNPESLGRFTEQREAIRGLVAGSVEGLRVDDVTLFVDVAQVRVPMVVRPAAPPRALVWALLLAMLTFATGFIALLVRHSFAPPAAPGATVAPVPTANLEPGPARPVAAPQPKQQPKTQAKPAASEFPRTLIRAPQRAA